MKTLLDVETEEEEDEEEEASPWSCSEGAGMTVWTKEGRSKLRWVCCCCFSRCEEEDEAEGGGGRGGRGKVTIAPALTRRESDVVKGQLFRIESSEKRLLEVSTRA